MKRPDENYDWNNAVGKGMIRRGHHWSGRHSSGPDTFPQLAIINKMTAKTVIYYHPDSPSDTTRMEKAGALFVEATEEDLQRVVEAWKARNTDIREATRAADSLYQEACEELLS